MIVFIQSNYCTFIKIWQVYIIIKIVKKNYVKLKIRKRFFKDNNFIKNKNENLQLSILNFIKAINNNNIKILIIKLCQSKLIINL